VLTFFFGQGIGVSTPIGGRYKYLVSLCVGILGTEMKWSDAEPGADVSIPITFGIETSAWPLQKHNIIMS